MVEDGGLLVEILLESVEFVLFQHATLPPGHEKSCAITEQLDESGADTLQPYRQAAVAYGGVDEDE